MMYCKKCENEISNNSKFCMYCGAVQDADIDDNTDIEQKTFSEFNNEVNDDNANKNIQVNPKPIKKCNKKRFITIIVLCAIVLSLHY